MAAVPGLPRRGGGLRSEERIQSAMTVVDESVESLRERLQQAEAELARRNEQYARLEKANRELSQRVQQQGEAGNAPAEISEIEETLKRMMQRIAMIVQGGKALFLIHNPEDEELVGDIPAFGFDDLDVRTLHVKDSEGISGEVYTTGRPTIFYDAETDDRAAREKFADHGIRNGLCVPLIIERRDEETNKILDRKTIGVLHVFNKRFGNIFIEEDIQLLERLAKNTAAIINSAESVRKIVKERDEVIETIQSLSMGLVMVGRNRRITQMNNSALKVFGLKKEDLAGGRTFDQVIKDEKVVDVLNRALTEEAELVEEVSLATDADHPDAFHTFQIQTAVVRGDTGDVIGVATIFNDITDIKNVDKMKTAFVSTVSHELRTPLTSIKGFISTLLQDTDGFYDNDTRLEFYTIIDTECDRLRRLIDDLLNVSRIESGATLEMNATPFNLRDMLDKVMMIQNGSTYKKSNHTLSYELPADVPPAIEADQDKVEQVFHNLIGNALKYAPGGGPVTVTARTLHDQGMIEFAITDKGIGMSDQFLKKVGEKFARADNRDTRTIGGTGIGLFLVKAFVEGHGGKMWPHSEGEGKGSTMFFTLPIKQPTDGSGGNLSSAVAG
jgi:two-component system phosphate regulon sensor histidine kinase PhoR